MRVQLENTNFWLDAHNPSECHEGQPCTLHNRSDHHMRTWPQLWRWDCNLVERVCPHGVGHPDPDSPRGTDMTHGCDGCCTATGRFSGVTAQDDAESTPEQSRGT